MNSVENGIPPNDVENLRKSTSHCFHCDTSFNILKRRNQCGHCDKNFCKNCTSKKVQIPKYGHKKPINVCSYCFVAICVDLFDRKSLEGQTVEELKRYAHRNGIEIQGPMDKSELIERYFDIHAAKLAPKVTTTSYAFKNEDLPDPKDSSGYPAIENKNQIGTINELNVSSLKLILHNNGIDHTDCIEKSELIHKVKKFCPQVLDISTRSELFNIPENEQCIICFDRRIDCVLLECGHLAVCMSCSKNLRECPICRRMVSRVVQTFHVNR